MAKVWSKITSFAGIQNMVAIAMQEATTPTVAMDTGTGLLSETPESPQISAPENSLIKGRYDAAISDGWTFPDGAYYVAYYNLDGGDMAMIGSDEFEVRGGRRVAYPVLADMTQPDNTSILAIRDRILALKILDGSHRLTVTAYETSTTTPIPDAEVTIWNGAGTLMIGTCHTNSDGRTRDAHGNDLIMLNAGDYILLPRKGGVSFAAHAITITEDDGPTAVTVFGTVNRVSVPIPAGACRVYELCYMPDGQTPMISRDVKARARIISIPFDSNGRLHTGQVVAAHYDAINGEAFWDLAPGAVVEFMIDHLHDRPVEKTIPDDTQRIRLAAIGIPDTPTP